MRGYTALFSLVLTLASIQQAVSVDIILLAPKTLARGEAYNVSVLLKPSAGDSSIRKCKVKLALTQCYGDDTILTQSEQDVNLDQQAHMSLLLPKSATVLNSYGQYALRASSSDCPGVNVTAENWRSGCVSEKVAGSSISIYIQTDKRMYKPGQTVKLRAFALYTSNLTAVTTSGFLIEITDAQGNKVQEWREQKSASGVINKTLPLSSRPVLGDWSIRATLGDVTRDTIISVAEYVLPTFEVKPTLPVSYYVRGDDTFAVNVGALYTYGKPVIGSCSVELSVPQPRYYWMDTVSATPAVVVRRSFKLTADQPVAKLTFSKSEIESLGANGNEISILAMVTEQATGVLRNASISATVYDSAYKIALVDGATPNAYRPEFAFVGFLKVTKQDDSLISSDELQRIGLSVATTFTCENWNRWQTPTESPTIQNTNNAIDGTGLVVINITVPASMSCSAITLNAVLNATASKVKLPPAYSNRFRKFGTIDNVILKVSLAEQTPTSGSFQVGQTVSVQATVRGGTTSVLYYAVVARGRLVHQAAIQSATTLPSNERWIVKLKLDMTPKCVILVWTVVNGEVVGDNLELDVDGALQDVKLEYDGAEKRVGETAKLSVQSEEGSYVAVLAVDKSALLLGGNGNDVQRAAVLRQVLCYDNNCPDQPGDIMPYRGFRPFGCFVPWYMYDGMSTADLFDKAGLYLLTSYRLYSNQGPRPRYYASRGGIEDDFGIVAMSNRADDNQLEMAKPMMAKSGTEVKVRREFPETWLWLDIDGDYNGGTVNVRKLVPDSITTWVTTAFAIHPTRGIGVADAAELRVFNPFFITMQLPYSVVRGEQFELKVLVFNYAVTSTSVEVTLEESADIVVAGANDLESSSSNKNGQSVSEQVTVQRDVPETVTFRVTARKIGKIVLKARAVSEQESLSDALERELVVIAEGIGQVETVAQLVTVSSNSEWSDNVTVVLPKTVVAESVRVTVAVFGDFLGSTINGIDKLLQMPYGCGEQNMLNFAPNIYVTKYLITRAMLTDAIRDKSQTYMVTGYQRELTYKRNDGSFSAFGEQDAAGSLWLTAFVVRCFLQANQFIYVDNTSVNGAINWIMARFDSNERVFLDPGRVLHADMQGGSARGVSLNAYALIALFENSTMRSTILNDRQNAAIVRAAVQKIEQTPLESLTSYELSIVLYALTLFEQSSSVGNIWSRLNSQKRVAADKTYWPAASTETSSMSTSPIEIETAAYVLLHLVRKKDVSTGLPILRWLVSKRNKDGGFMSTQDTVVGLQALSEFAALVSPSERLNVEVVVAVGSTFSQSVTVNNENQLLVQKVEIPTDVKVDSVKLSASGSGVALVQVTWEYSVQQANESLNGPVNVLAASKLFDDGRTLKLRFCSSWKSDAPSGMFLSEANLPTGFSLDSSESELREQFKNKPFGLKMVEQNGDRTVSLYFDEIPKGEEVCTMIRARETMRVANRKAAVVRSMPYYAPQNVRSAMYTAGDGSLMADTLFDNNSATSVRWSWVFIVSQLLLAYICMILGCMVYY